MGRIKEYYHDYLSAEEFDLMFDDEFEQWLLNQNKINQKNQTKWEDQKEQKTAQHNNNR